MCRLKGDFLSTGFPFSREWDESNDRHRTTPTEVGVQWNMVSPEGRLFVYWIPVFTGMGWETDYLALIQSLMAAGRVSRALAPT